MHIFSSYDAAFVGKSRALTGLPRDKIRFGLTSPCSAEIEAAHFKPSAV